MAALILPSRRVVQPQGPVEVGPYWRDKNPVLLASGANQFVNTVNGLAPSVGSTASFSASSIGVGATGSAAATTSSILFEDYPFGGTTPITVIAFLESLPGANRSYVAQGTEVVLRTSAAGTGVEFILNSFATNDRVTVTPDTRSSPGLFAAGTYGPSGKLRAYGNTAMAEVTPTGTYGDNTDVFSAIYTSGLNQLLDKRLALVAIFRSEFFQAELKEICANPWQLFRPIQRRIWVPVAGGGGISQTVAFTLEDVSAAVSQNLSHAQSLTGTLDDVAVSISQTAQHDQALSATLDDIEFDAVQVGALPAVGGMGFVFTDMPSTMWWKRKPKAITEEVAKKKIKRVVRAIEQATREQVAQPAAQQQREVYQAIAPLLEEMPGFDWKQVFRLIVAQDAARRQMEATIARAKQIEQDDEDVLMLLLSH